MIKSHWTPLYFWNKIKNKIWETQNPDAPWLTSDAVNLLNELIKNTDTGLEFGSGRSTYWLAKRMKYLTSVEDNENWYQKVKSILNANKKNNVNYLLKSSSNALAELSDYCQVVVDFEDNSLDFVLVDGSQRDVIALLVQPKIKTGGLLVLDNANWFLPHATYSPSSIGEGSIQNENWQKFYSSLEDWRIIWTSNGISDTAIFIKKH